MAEPFLSEIRICSFHFPPKGWAYCNGQLLPINQNQALFALLGTMYGGNGQTNFALPDLRGRAPIHVGNGHIQGEAAGQEATTLTQQTMPAHIHGLAAQTEVVQPDFAAQDPTGKVFAGASIAQQGGNKAAVKMYHKKGNSQLVAMHPQAVSNTGGSQPHENMQPYLVLNYIIALQGIFPSRN